MTAFALNELCEQSTQFCWFTFDCSRETIPCEQSESRLRESKIQSTKIERLLSLPVSLGKVVIATFGILIYVVRRSERRHSVMVSDYYFMKSTEIFLI
ncbi:hypothetical protein T07_12417 [Trichinella nelsoni]|uniref:Uncharacterized protein n=1 Tax=Trichinella nelsoni TaxID=6336 RepID=A0A0V0SFM5_9BILA|nr:hypothetical protein T07_12417 [Trichinella nelsoni]